MLLKGQSFGFVDNAATLHRELHYPSPQDVFADIQRAAGFCNRVTLVKHQSGGFLLELRRKRSSFPRHQTPRLWRQYYHLRWCPESLNHYTSIRLRKLRTPAPESRVRSKLPEPIPLSRTRILWKCEANYHHHHRRLTINPNLCRLWIRPLLQCSSCNTCLQKNSLNALLSGA
jgi:hypothetical protein